MLKQYYLGQNSHTVLKWERITEIWTSRASVLSIGIKYWLWGEALRGILMCSWGSDCIWQLIHVFLKCCDGKAKHLWGHMQLVTTSLGILPHFQENHRKKYKLSNTEEVAEILTAKWSLKEAMGFPWKGEMFMMVVSKQSKYHVCGISLKHSPLYIYFFPWIFSGVISEEWESNIIKWEKMTDHPCFLLTSQPGRHLLKLARNTDS